MPKGGARKGAGRKVRTTPDDRVKITIRLPPDLAQSLKAQANYNAIITRLVQDWCDKGEG